MPRCCAESGRRHASDRGQSRGEEARREPDGDLRAILDAAGLPGAGGGVHGDPAVLRRPRGSRPHSRGCGRLQDALARNPRRGARGVVDGDVQLVRTGDRGRGDDGPRGDRDLRSGGEGLISLALSFSVRETWGGDDPRLALRETALPGAGRGVRHGAGRAGRLRHRFGIVAARSWRTCCACDTVVVAVKPQSCRPSCPGSPGRGAGKTFVSIVAGARSPSTKALGEGAKVVRTMPNTPVLVGMGSTGIYFPPTVDAATRQGPRPVLLSLGTVAGCPARAARRGDRALRFPVPPTRSLFLEALADGAVRAGMGRSGLALMTRPRGAARMVRETGKHPAGNQGYGDVPGEVSTAAGWPRWSAGPSRATVMDAVLSAWQQCRGFRAERGGKGCSWRGT